MKNKILFIAVINVLACLIGSCGKQQTDIESGVPELVRSEVSYKDEHTSLNVSYDIAVIKNDMIYGTFRDANGYVIVCQNKATGNIEKQIPLDTDLSVTSIMADNEGFVYFAAEKENKNRLYRIEKTGQYEEIADVAPVQNEDIINEGIQQIFRSDEGYYYIWQSAGVPASELLTDDAHKDDNAYVYVDQIYIMNDLMQMVYCKQVPRYQGTRLLGFQLGQNGEGLLLVKDTEGVYVEELSLEENNESSEKIYLEKADSYEISALFAATEHGVLYCRGNDLYEYDFETGERTELLNLSAYGFLTEDLLYIGKNGDIVEIIDTYKETGISEYTALVPGENDKQILSLAVVMESQDLREIVTAYNRYSRDYQINVVEYYTEESGYEEAVEKMKLDIISGNASDIIDVSDTDASILANKGVLVDLYDLMEQDITFSKDRFIPSVLKAYETNGCLYAIAPAFQLVTMWGNNRIIQNRSGISLSEFIDMLSASGKGLNAIWGFSADEPVLTTLCTFGMDEFIDWDNGTCDFTSDYFRDVLEFVKGYTGVYTESQSKGIQENAIVITVGELASVSDYQLAKALYGEDVFFVGYPTNSGSGTAASFRGEQLAINARKEHVDGAWDFIKFYILNGYSGGGFPIEADQFEACLSMAMQPEFVVEDGVSYELAKNRYSDGYANIEIYEASEQDTDAVRRLVDSVSNKFEYDISIMEIISEEAEGYLIGQKSLEEVTEIIQNRVSLYLEENCFPYDKNSLVEEHNDDTEDEIMQDHHYYGVNIIAGEEGTLIVPPPTDTEDYGENGPSNVIGKVCDDENYDLLSGATIMITPFKIGDDIVLSDISENEKDTDISQLTEKEDFYTVTTNSSGYFQVIGLPGGFYNWIVICDGYYESRFIAYSISAETTYFNFNVSAKESLCDVSYNYLRYKEDIDAMISSASD